MISDAETNITPVITVNDFYDTNEVTELSPYGFWESVAGDIPDLYIAATNGQEVRYNCGVRAFVTLAGTSTKVDAAPCDPNQYLTLDDITTNVPANITRGSGMECVDPRFNWRDAHGLWTNYVAGQDTIGDTNTATQIWLNTHPDCDDGLSMYVSDQGRLSCVGELGNLLRGRRPNNAFKTIRLYDTDAADRDRVFEYFTVTTNNEVKRGLVNLNTRNAEVLDKVFIDVPLKFPGSGTNLEWSLVCDTNGIRNAITNLTSRTNFFDVGEIGLLNWRDLLPDMTDLERESVISHSAGLLTVRHNLFTIFLRAESYSEGIGGKGGATLASAHGVAEVWRDPFRFEAGNTNHSCFVRFFKILED